MIERAGDLAASQVIYEWVLHGSSSPPPMRGEGESGALERSGRLVLMVGMVMVVGIRTGCVRCLSTAGLAVVSAAVLAQGYAPPEVAGELAQLLG